jgi:hypothetical protein
MNLVCLRQRAGICLILLLTISSGAVNSAPVPTLARICTTENQRGWITVSGFCHVLDFYGRGPTDLPLVASGDSALKALTDEDEAIRRFGKSPFEKTKHGLRYSLFDEVSVGVDLGEAHRDQCLAMFAALDLPASTPIRLRSGTYSIADLVSESLASFSFEQRELEWSAMALAKYVPPQTAWTNSAGQRLDFPGLVRKLLSVELNSEKCAGTHVLEALILIRQANQKNSLLDEPTREQLNSYLKKTIREIIEKQRADGSWSRSWCAAVNDNSEPFSPFQISFLVTGHLAEILNKLDLESRPPRSVYVNAATWITNSMNSTEIRPNGFWVCPFTHAAHAAREILK